MSAHSQFVDWKLGDEVPEGLIEDIAWCVQKNVEIKPGAYAVLCDADNIVSQLCGWKLENWEIDDEFIGKAVAKVPRYNLQLAEVIKAVMLKLEEEHDKSRDRKGDC